MSALVTVLTMWRSWNRAIPSGAPKSDSGRMRRSAPLMVILGSLGCSTITTASMSGMLMHVSSPKHLQKTSVSNQNTRGLLGTTAGVELFRGRLDPISHAAGFELATI